MEEVVQALTFSALERRTLGLQEGISWATDGELWDPGGVVTREQKGPGVDKHGSWWLET
jgi:hypothetical protein